MFEPKLSSVLSSSAAVQEDTVLIKATSLQAYFHETLGDARRDHDFDATEASEYYIVTLLDAFAKADKLFGVDEKGQRGDQALAMMLHDAVFDAPGRLEHYRRLGDVALYMAGFFADSLHRSSVGVSYYIEMGRGAYHNLASLMREKRRRALQEVFGELADTFGRWVEVLRDMSERMGLSPDITRQDTLDLHNRLAAVSGVRASRIYGQLARRGALPGFGVASIG